MADERWDELKEHFKTTDELCDYAEKYAYEIEDAAMDAANDEMIEELSEVTRQAALQAKPQPAVTFRVPDFVALKAGLITDAEFMDALKSMADAAKACGIYYTRKKPKPTQSE